MFFVKNVNVVEKFINLNKKHAYYSLLIAIANKNYDQAEQYMKKLGGIYNQTKIAVQANIYLENKELQKAEETIQRIKNYNIRNHYLALAALLRGYHGLFEGKRLITRWIEKEQNLK
jgi:tetratricopeptide (TPR) repeat protein